MKRDWLYTLFLLISPSLLFSKVVLSEVMYNPIGPENRDEFIEIFNLSETDSVNLTGWRIGDGSDDDEIINAGEGLLLLPLQYGLILDADYFGQSDSYDSLIPESSLILTINGSTLGSGGLSNSQQETVTLYDDFYQPIDQYIYSIGNQPGHSDEIIDLWDSDDNDNWAESQVLGGTPGFQNSITKLQWDAGISRLWIKPDHGTREDQFYLFTSIVNMGSISIKDAQIIFFQDKDGDSLLSFEEEIHNISIDQEICSGDSIEISCYWSSAVSGAHSIGVVVQMVKDERPENNFLTLEVMVGFIRNDLAINEIMFQPASNLCEWIELYNPGDTSICLRDWQISDQDTTDKIEFGSITTEILSKGYCILAKDSSLFELFPAFENPYLAIQKFPNLNNFTDQVNLYDPMGNMIDQVEYHQSWGGGEGISIERIHPEIFSQDSSNWSPSAAYEGMTPGFQNSVYTEILPLAGSIMVSPNPFSPDGDGVDDAAVISYSLPMVVAYVNLTIYDVRGRCIRTLLGASYSASNNHVIWDGLDNFGKRARIGIYVVFLEGLNGSMDRLIQKRTAVVLAGRL